MNEKWKLLNVDSPAEYESSGENYEKKKKSQMKKLEISFDAFAAAMTRRRPNEPSLINSSIPDICKNNVKKY